jgi:hypothetical protein
MVLCKEDQIKNPITNRCVSISGITAKNIIKKYNLGEITLNPENVQKIAKKNIIKKDVSLLKKIIIKKNVAKDVSLLKKKNEYSISKQIEYNKTNSIKKVDDKINSVKPKSLNNNIKPIPKSEISNKTKIKITNFIEEWKKKNQ